MALMVGELAATISVDESGAVAGIARAERAMQDGGDRITADADRAGQDAGDAIGDGVAEGAEEGAAHGGKAMLTQFKGLAAAAVGSAIGAALVGGVMEALNQSSITGKLGVQLGATPATAARYGKIAGKLYADAITEDFQGAADAIKATMASGLLPPTATNAQIASIATQVHDLSDAFDLDLGEAAKAVGQMIRTGMAPNAKAGLDLIAAGLKGTDSRAEDALETITEYGVIFQTAGITGQTAMGLIRQALAAGAKDTDKLGDAVKEFTLITTAGGSSVDDAFKSIGLNGKKLGADVGAGGARAAGALDKVLDTLRQMPASTARAQAVQTLFGGPGEDLGAALFALDVDKAGKSLGNTAGQAGKLGDTLRSGPAVQVEQFKRRLQQGFVELMGSKVVPILSTFVIWLSKSGERLRAASAFVSAHSTSLSIAAGVILTLMLPTLVALAVQAVTTSTAVVTGWVAQGAAATVSAGRAAAANVITLAGWVRSAATATASAAIVVAGWVLMGVQSLIRAGQMAAAWLIAMGPVALIIAVVIGLVALIIMNWDTIKSATLAVWDWIWAKIKWAADMALQLFLNFTLVGLIVKHWTEIKDKTAAIWNATIGWVAGIPGRLYNLFLNWTLYGLIISHWTEIKTGTQRKAGEMLAYVRGLPGTIAGYFSGFGSLLYGKGRDLVYGLWDGIKGMGPWLRSTLMSWATRMIPGPIAKALGIHSPSRVMRDEIGRHIPAGLVAGITAGQGAVDDAMSNLVTLPRTSGALGITAGTSAAGSTGTGGAGPEIRVVIDARGSDDLTRWLRKTVRIEGRGNVQTAFGT